MKQVAKAVIVDDSGKYLLMYRAAHPTFGDDPDLPGGTLEKDEQTLEAMIREVYEEAAITISKPEVRLVYSGAKYSAHGTHYSLYVATLNARPDVAISWEHASYEWLEKPDFLEKAKGANDTYMHMVYDQLMKNDNYLL